MPNDEPAILHHLLISATAAVSSFGSEMMARAHISSNDPTTVDAYWRGVEELAFNKAA
jgi:hypothetical protein